MKDLDFDEMVGTYESMRQVFVLINKVAATNVPVLITGPNGTGKETVAQAIHQRSLRAHRPLVEINCGTIPRGPLDSGLSSDEKGAYTKIYCANAELGEPTQKGTLFLNDVDKLPINLQVKFLDFLPELSSARAECRPPAQVDFRIISATKVDLQKLVAAGRFQEDLYSRLNVVNISLPPLKDRGEDVIILANVFLKRFAGEYGKDFEGFTPEAVAALKKHSWPGNVRELFTRVRLAVVVSENSQLTPDHLALQNINPSPMPRFKGQSLKEAREEFEAHLLQEAMLQFQGNIQLASRALKVSRSTMYHFIQKYQLKKYKHLIPKVTKKRVVSA